MANPSILSRLKFSEIKKRNPKKAQKIEERASGEIYGLKPVSDGYGSDETIEVTYNEGSYIEGVE